MRLFARLLLGALLCLPGAPGARATGLNPVARAQVDAQADAADAEPPAEATAALAFVAALFAHDCGHIDRHVAFPARMGVTTAQRRADLIPDEACDPEPDDEADPLEVLEEADPLEVLEEAGLTAVSVEVTAFAVWARTAETAAITETAAAGARPTDRVVVATFERARDHGVQSARVLLSGPTDAPVVTGYWD